jgi:hypothetical protein
MKLKGVAPDADIDQDLVKQAKQQGVAVWMKQMGGPRPGGELKDFPEDLRLREFPRYELGGTP